MKLQKYISKVLDILIAIVLLLFFASFGFRDGRTSGWYQQFFPNMNGSTIMSMTFLDSLTGFAATNTNSLIQGYILKTTNGGDNWNIIFTYDSLPYNNITFTSLKFADKNIGYVGTNYYDLFKTTDGGNNWQKLYISFGCSDMAAINKDTVLIVQSDIIDGGVYRSTNGGLNWQALGPTGGSGQPGSIYMFNKDIGFNLGSSGMKKTTNGGLNWFMIPNETYSGIKFIDTLTGWKCWDSIKKTTNGGLNWFAQRTPSISLNFAPYSSFSINNRDTIWMVGARNFSHIP
ncbi:MAG TPA: YCF48-related protein, partial [Ignavibacteria bacterium]